MCTAWLSLHNTGRFDLPKNARCDIVILFLHGLADLERQACIRSFIDSFHAVTRKESLELALGLPQEAAASARAIQSMNERDLRKNVI